MESNNLNIGGVATSDFPIICGNKICQTLSAIYILESHADELRMNLQTELGIKSGHGDEIIDGFVKSAIYDSEIYIEYTSNDGITRIKL